MTPVRNLANDLLITAVEGGSNYWALFLNYELPGQFTDGSVVVIDNEEQEVAEFNFLGHVLNWDQIGLEVENGEIETHYINGGHIEQVLRKMGRGDAYDLPMRWQKFAIDLMVEPEECDYDAGDADVVLQLAVFGEVVYG